MATARKPFASAEDRKKHDDPQSKGPLGLASWLPSLKTVRRRRIFFGLLALWLLYFFIKNIPTDVPPVSKRFDHYGPQRPPSPSPPSAGDKTTEHHPEALPVEQLDEDYDGPIKFYKLVPSLRGSSQVYHSKTCVLFAFSSTKSASLVLSAACSMAYENKTSVHVAIMGRYHVDAESLLELNGISPPECPITWHEAQPDHSAHSTVGRMRTSVEAALAHIHNTLSIQAVIFDDSPREDEYFRTAIKARSRLFWIPTISVPERDAWMLALDAQSLRHWNDVSIDIVVRAPPESSGSLIRLMKSLQKADYGLLSYPKLTVELPALADSALLDYIEGYQWPPNTSPSDRKLTVRRQADPKLRVPSAASLSTLESFYPTTLHSHVVILSPDVELSTNYYQVLSYLLLDYKYGSQHSHLSHQLVGISLESLPAPAHSNSTSFALTQTPSGTAALYFADRWNDMHNFITLRIQSDPEWEKAVDSDLISKLASTEAPAWLKAASEMMQAQSYYLFHPVLDKGDSPFVTVHRELTQTSYEVSAAAEASTGSSGSKDDLDMNEEGAVLTAMMKHQQPSDLEKPMLSISSVFSMLRVAANREASLQTTPIYDASGKEISWDDAAARKTVYRDKFVRAVGGCTEKDRKNTDEDQGGIADLFCV